MDLLSNMLRHSTAESRSISLCAGCTLSSIWQTKEEKFTITEQSSYQSIELQILINNIPIRPLFGRQKKKQIERDLNLMKCEKGEYSPAGSLITPS